MDSFLDLNSSTPPTGTGTADDIMSSIFGGPIKEKKPIDAIESIFGSTDVSPLIKSTTPPVLNEENTTETTSTTTTTTLDNNSSNNSSVDDVIVEVPEITETVAVSSVVDNSPPLPIETQTTTDEPIFIQNAPILVVNPLEVIAKKIESDDEKDNTSDNNEDIVIENEIFTPINAAIESLSSPNSPSSTKDETTTKSSSTSQESPSNSFSMSVSSIADELSNSNIISSTVTGTIEQQVYEKQDEPQISPLLSEFNKIFHSTIPLENSPLEILKISAFTGALKYSPLRGLAWKLFLGGLDINRLDKWEIDITKQRKRYEKLKEEHCFDPRNSNSPYDPLSQNDDSPWNKFFKNLDVQKIIKIDLERTHPDNDFFSNPVIREMMLHILFVYSRTNGVISYRQGMHELLAPIISLYHQEYTGYKKLDGDEISLVDFIYDKEYLEHDTFAIFEHLMKFTADWYAPALPNLTPTAPPPPTTTTVTTTTSFSVSSSSSPTSPLSLSSNSTTAVTAPQTLSTSLPSSPNSSHIPKSTTNTLSSSVEDSESSSTKYNDVVQKCKFIHSVLLKQKDNELYLHLNSLDIEPQIYLLRWVRLLFGREFHFDDVLNIWDALFAYGENLAMIDYFCISMLTYIREHLLKSDSIYALKRIYKYPPVEDVYMLIKKSLELKDSNCSIAVMVKTAQPPLASSCNSSGKQVNNNNNNSNSLNNSSNINVTSNFPSSINNSVFPEIYIGESSTSSSTTSTASSFQPYSSQFSSSSTTPIDPLSNKTTPIIISSHTTTATVSSTHATTTLNNSSGSNTPLSLSSNSTTASSTPNLLNTPNLATHHSSPNVLSGQHTPQPSHSNIASTFFNNSNNNNSNSNSQYQAATVSVRTNHKDIFGGAKEADLFSLFSTATTNNIGGSGMSLSSSNPTISIGQARSNYNKHKSMNLSASPFFSTPSSSSAEIEKLKNNQTKLANSLNEILPFLEKGKSYLTGGEEELSKSDIDNFILAIDKVKQVQEALSNNNNNTTINE